MRIGITLDQTAALERLEREVIIGRQQSGGGRKPCLAVRGLAIMPQRAAAPTAHGRDEIESDKPQQCTGSYAAAPVDQTVEAREQLWPILDPLTKPFRQRAADLLHARM